ncbi:MAG: hypothetical protein C3F13_04380 [Anaerolineales bacterium]|nr:hypothetical protein [Anaerolineae bacterium]PWB55523.1 MAG: hypothetical protein C3F13_04380 [Anaerolineales bacterium]
MKRMATAALVALLCQFLFSPTQPTASQADTWMTGTYLGWVYFLERSDFDYTLNENGVMAKDSTTLYHETHGEIECTVSDEAGNGSCTATFPLEKIAGRSGTFTSEGCNATWTESIRAPAVGGTQPLSPLLASSLGDGFSIPFLPTSGDAYAKLTVNASGSPTCQSQAISTKTKLGITKWPNLDFHVTSHTLLSAGGECSMADFPRKMTVGRAVTKATIEQCEWRMFYYDPYAKLP